MGTALLVPASRALPSRLFLVVSPKERSLPALRVRNPSATATPSLMEGAKKGVLLGNSGAVRPRTSKRRRPPVLQIQGEMILVVSVGDNQTCAPPRLQPSTSSREHSSISFLLDSHGYLKCKIK